MFLKHETKCIFVCSNLHVFVRQNVYIITIFTFSSDYECVETKLFAEF